MRIFIIASEKNTSFAQELIRDIPGQHFFMSQINANSIWQMTAENEIKKADVVVVIIDHDFSNSVYLNEELRTLYYGADKERCIIPVVFKGAQIPYDIGTMHHVTYDPNLEGSAEAVKKIVESIIKEFQSGQRKQKFNTRFQRSDAMLTITSIIAFVAGIIPLVVWKFDTLGIVLASTFLPMAAATLVANIVLVFYRNKTHAEIVERESYSRRLNNIVVPIAADKPPKRGDTSKNEVEVDAVRRMLLNLDDLKGFYTWSKQQAKAAFTLSIAMCIAGFLLMVAGMVLSFVVEFSLAITLIPAICGGIVEVVAGTALFVYKKSLVQLNYYHSALHEDERFLSSVTLLSKFHSVETQDEMLKEIIRSEIQMNMKSLETHKQKLEK